MKLLNVGEKVLEKSKIFQRKTILLFVTILLFSAYYVAAWNPNPTYNTFETIWNMFSNLEGQIDTIPINEFVLLSFLMNQMEPETEIPFEEIADHFEGQDPSRTQIIQAPDGEAKLHITKALVTYVEPGVSSIPRWFSVNVSYQAVQSSCEQRSSR